MQQHSTRDVILNTAEALFAERGYQGLSMRDLAENAGVSKANLYYHFATKRDLYLRVLNRGLETMELTLDHAAAAEGTTRQRLTRLVDAYLSLIQHKRALIYFIMRDIGGFDSEVRNLIVHHWERLLRPIETVIEDGIARGELRSLDPRLTALSLTAMLRGLITLQFLAGEAEIDPDFAEHTLDLFFRGIEAHL